MRCLSPGEVTSLFGTEGFSISFEHAWYRLALRLDHSEASQQTRIAAHQPTELVRVPDFVRRLNRWLPSNQARLLWVDHWNAGAYGFEDAIVAAARVGWGEPRPIEEAPGFYFDRQNWAEEDQVQVLPSQAEAMGALVGLLSILMLTESDGWLISSECPDRIEFWEGNFFFHTKENEQLALGRTIMDEFGCVRWSE
ncbi:MAG: hypothetical protein ACREEB_14135 [Caulobacteraceae bacterium]